jgi:hypothetical protein
MMERLTCTRLVEEKQRDNNGKWIISHRLCGAPASEATLGQFARARAILCQEHLQQAERQARISKQGYRALIS